MGNGVDGDLSTFKRDPLLIAFDVDDTLIVPAVATGFDRDVPNYETIAIYRWFQAQGNQMIIWSGGGADYARVWAEKLGLVADYYHDKHDPTAAIPDIAFDDGTINLGVVNVKVKRINNSIVRYPDRVRGKGTPTP